MSKKFLISGVGPGPAGVGRVVEYLILNSNNLGFIFPPMGRSISVKKGLLSFKFKNIVCFFIDFVKFHITKSSFNLKMRILKNKDVILLHPQTIGYKNVKRLILRNNVSIYVMDNSFFCIKSYNYLNSSEKACMLCLEMSYRNAHKNSCVSFPVDYDYEEYFSFVTFLKTHIQSINFIVQNQGQLDLLKKQFGNEISYIEIGLLTSDMFEEQNLPLINTKKKYDFVFHGDNTLAKGSKYIFEIAKRLPEFSFLFPFNKNVEEDLENVDFIKMEWTTGLKEYVLSSKLTLCPSIWSAPIEGSVVKTLNLGVALGVFDSEYSFSKEIPNHSVLRLSGYLENDIKLLKEFILLENYREMRDNGKSYIDKKIQEMILNFEKIFKL